MSSFFRIGAPLLVPVSRTSATTPFDLSGGLEAWLKAKGKDLTFMFSNPNPFDVRLEGTGRDPVTGNVRPFQVVTPTTGWSILARVDAKGPFTSKNPIMLSAMAWDHKGCPIPADYDFSGCFIELVYGRGE